MRKRYYVYAVGSSDLQWTKIGFSSNPKRRLDVLQTCSPFHLVMGKLVEFSDEVEAKTQERSLRGEIAREFNARVKKEWVNVGYERVVAYLSREKPRRPKSLPWWMQFGFSSKQEYFAAHPPGRREAILEEMVRAKGL
jgi:hypothetical protein